MNSGEKEHYYNFDYLLRPAPRMLPEEQNALMDKFIPNEEDRKNLYIDVAINTFAIGGDTTYEKSVAFAHAVATEVIMDTTKATMQKQNAKANDVLVKIMYKLNTKPATKLNFFRLFDFEMFLLRQKQERLTRKNKSV